MPFFGVFYDRFNRERGEYVHRILIVENDPDLINITEVHLKHSGYLTDKARLLSELPALLEKNEYALILMDVPLSDGDSEELCRSVRELCPCPIIFLGCLDTTDPILSAFGADADDYMVKPVRYDELLQHIETRILSSGTGAGSFGSDDNLIRLNRLLIDFQRRRVLREGVETELSSIEFSLLKYMVSKRDTLLLYEELYRNVWGTECLGDIRTVMVHISNLRKKIDPNRVGLIETVRGAGYIFTDV